MTILIEPLIYPSLPRTRESRKLILLDCLFRGDDDIAINQSFLINFDLAGVDHV